jgi:hypothetical protein
MVPCAGAGEPVKAAALAAALVASVGTILGAAVPLPRWFAID